MKKLPTYNIIKENMFGNNNEIISPELLLHYRVIAGLVFNMLIIACSSKV